MLPSKFRKSRPDLDFSDHRQHPAIGVAYAFHSAPDEAVKAVCKAICQSGRFETGQGTCAVSCMSELGDARAKPHGCPHAGRVHAKLAQAIVDALTQVREGGE